MPDIINIVVSKEAIDGLVEADKKTVLLDDNFTKLNKTLEQTVKSLNVVGTSVNKLQEAEKKTADNTEKLNDEQQKLEKIEKRVAENTDKVVKAKIEASRKTKEQKERITELIQAEKEEIGTEKRLELQNKKLIKERKTLNAETKQGSTRIKEINSQLDKNNATLKANKSGLEQQKIGIGGYTDGIKNALSQLGIMPGALTKVSGATSSLGTNLAGVTKSTTGTAKAMKILKIAFISTGIGALVIAVIALVTWFKKTVAGGEALVKIMAPLKAIFQVLVNRIAKMGEALAALFTGDFSAAADKFKESLSGVSDELVRQIRLQRILADLEIELKKDVGDLAISQAQLNNQIQKGRLAARDETITLKERIKAQKQSIIATKALAESRANNLRREIALMVANEQAGISSQDEINERKQKIADLIAIEGERDRGLLRIVEFLKTLNREQEKQNRIAENAKGRAKLSSDITATILKNEQDLADDLEDLNDELTSELEKDLKERISNALSAQMIIAQNADLGARAELIILKEALVSGDITREQFAKRATEIEQEKNKTILEFNISLLQKELENSNLSADEKLRIEKELMNALADLRDEELNSELEDIETAKQARIQAINDIIAVTRGAQEVANAIFASDMAQLNAQSEAQAFQKQQELAQAEGNAERQQEIKEKFAKKEADLRRRKAEQEKEAAIFNATINLATAIIQALNAGPGIGLALAVLTAAVGAIELATVISTPIPQFFTGTRNTPDGPLSIAERGAELARKRSGELMLFSKPTITSELGKGAQIYTNKETRKIFSNAGYDSPEIMNAILDSNNQVINSSKMVAKALAHQPRNYFSKEKIINKRGPNRQEWYKRKVTGINW